MKHQFMNRPLFTRVMGMIGAVMLFLSISWMPGAAAADLSAKDLVGSIWLAKKTHDRTSIDRSGTIKVKQGKNKVPNLLPPEVKTKTTIKIVPAALLWPWNYWQPYSHGP